MQFNYIAEKSNGEEINGTMEAKDRFELAQTLRKQGYAVISVKEKARARSSLFFSFLNIKKVSAQDKIMFAKNLGVMIAAGLPITRSLEILNRQTSNKKFKKIIISLMASIQKGDFLSEAMKKYPNAFSSLFIAMVKVGEESGKLSESLKTVGEQIEKDYILAKKVKGAMIYPIIIMIAMVIIGIFMFIYVVPTLVSTFTELNVDLPLSTRVIILISNTLTGHIIISSLILLSAALTVFWFLRSQKGKNILGKALVRLPLISPIVKKINSARTSRTLASLISSGVNILEALSITKDVVQNQRYKSVLDKAINDVQKGTPISKAFKEANNLYPVLLSEMMAVGEETGKTAEMLERLAVFYEQEVADATKDMAAVIEPILMIFIGAVVGFFAMSMIKPMYSLMSGI
ncbi:MAG: type II secretion system F family protein [Patescibacteria group bacterium]